MSNSVFNDAWIDTVSGVRSATSQDYQRFMDRVSPEPTSGCWLWTGVVNPQTGYGQFGRCTTAHRLSYQFHVGRIPQGLVIDHLCRVRTCVNPQHMEVVTQQENIRRGDAPRRRREQALAAIACAAGHTWTPESTGIQTAVGGGSVWRFCRICNRLAQRRRRALAKTGPRPSDQPPIFEGDEGAPATRGDQPALSYRKCIECGSLAIWGTLCRDCAGDKYDDRREDYDDGTVGTPDDWGLPQR
jgi:hypothetical protein